MADRYPNQLQLWESAGAPVLDGQGALAPLTGIPAFHFSDDQAARLYVDESLSSEEQPTTEPSEPCSLQWFLDIENLRHKKYGRWIPTVLEFQRHTGETLLGLGPGLGTDWVQYARHGASVVVCSPTTEHLMLVRRNFEVRGLKGTFLQAPALPLPLASASIDVVCMNNLPEMQTDQEMLSEEVHRVLKPGGKVLAVVPARYDIDHWRRLLLPLNHWWKLWREGTSRPSPSFTGRGLRKLFHQFVEHRTHKRHLRRADVPHLWRVVSLACLERLVGRVLILKAFKPLSAALSVSLAA